MKLACPNLGLLSSQPSPQLKTAPINSYRLVKKCHIYVYQTNTKQVYFPPNNIYRNWMMNPFTGTLQIEDLAIDECKSCKILRMMQFQNKNSPLFQAFGSA